MCEDEVCVLVFKPNISQSGAAFNPTSDHQQNPLQPAAANRGGTKKNALPAHPEQPGSLQGGARTAVSLSVAEIRRLFWCLVLATQQRVERILAWSMWRRWHQGIAKYWHSKRRAVS
jgi:hypothetical protein